MIWAFLSARGFLGLAKGIWVAIALAALIGGFALWLANEKRDAVEADRARSNAEALARARGADEAGLARTGQEREAIEAQNEEARRAAEQSDDPLKAGLDKLREGR